MLQLSIANWEPCCSNRCQRPTDDAHDPCEWVCIFNDGSYSCRVMYVFCKNCFLNTHVQHTHSTHNEIFTCFLSIGWTDPTDTQSSYLWRAWHTYRLDRREGHWPMSERSCQYSISIQFTVDSCYSQLLVIVSLLGGTQASTQCCCFRTAAYTKNPSREIQSTT